MPFYDLSAKERTQLVEKIHRDIFDDLKHGKEDNTINYFSDQDTYIRKTAYQSVGKIYFSERNLRPHILQMLNNLLASDNELIRQTTINAAGEIGKFYFKEVQSFFDTALFDPHHKVRNAVIGSVKKMGAKNPIPTLAWAKNYLQHPDKEIRREICHGIELRGRKFPQDVLPLLKALEFDETTRVSDTLIHVLGQIAYKKGCLATVVSHLNTWQNTTLVQKALDEIVAIHDRYKSFAVLTQEQAIDYIDANYNSGHK